MQTLEIQVPENKTRLVKKLLKEPGITVKAKKENKVPNADTIAAMQELKAGKGKRYESADKLFSI